MIEPLAGDDAEARSAALATIVASGDPRVARVIEALGDGRLHFEDGAGVLVEDGKAIRQIREVSGLYDVGPVLNPAYVQTSAGVAMRSYEAWLASQTPAEPEAVAEFAKRSLVRDAATAWALRLRRV